MFGNRWLKSTNFQDLCLEASEDKTQLITASEAFRQESDGTGSVHLKTGAIAQTDQRKNTKPVLRASA